MKMYTDFNLAYDGDDFIHNRKKIYKDFSIGEFTYRLIYDNSSRILTITKRDGELKVSQMFSMDFIKAETDMAIYIFESEWLKVKNQSIKAV